MPALNTPRARKHLQQFDFRQLFVDELGWNRHDVSHEVALSLERYELRAVAEKRGMPVFVCSAIGTARGIPDYQARRKIDKQATRIAHEHIIIYVDGARKQQVWQWVKRESGRPAIAREFRYDTVQSGDPLLQRLEGLSVSLDEEDNLTIVDVTSRVRAAFDVEKVTRRFYERFREEHGAFLKFIEGITQLADKEWYASLMLNRLMFVYFVQRKGFLDNDRDYLRKRLKLTQAHAGQDRFYSFYRHFLLRLFHEGLGQGKKTPDLDKLLGKVPYLNGGLFVPHPLEQRYNNIRIPDEAFERIFAFFDEYQWNLDERPLRKDNEINPDVLGYIFEKYINQKEMGAYYTKEDVTHYISANTIVPHLIDTVLAAVPDAAPVVWKQLAEEPDRYIHNDVRHGAEKPLPPHVAQGVRNVSLRDEWNKPAPPDYGLPTETWREVVDRRHRYESTLAAAAKGKIVTTEHIVAHNLDLSKFAQDVIQNTERPDFLIAFYRALEKVSVIDPTCGSGAFLFAALNVLEPLYDAALQRMESFVQDASSASADLTEAGNIIAHLESHRNRRYFVLKSIVVNNLYGVDIMEEATEICKLRLFLKLVAQVERVGEIEALPDIDFNIRAGNTLVGFATREEVEQSVRVGRKGERKLFLTPEETAALESIEDGARAADSVFKRFRSLQTADVTDPRELASAKADLRDHLAALRKELNKYLAAEYGVDSKDKPALAEWLAAHQPFHWFVEFYSIMRTGGFDVIIGNPPYVEMHKVKAYSVKKFKTSSCGNLYMLCVERATKLVREGGQLGVIVPLSGFSTERATEYQDFVWTQFSARLFLSYYSGDAHPSVLFEGVKYRLCILIGERRRGASERSVSCTDYRRWYADERPHLFTTLSYTGNPHTDGFLRFAKLGTQTSASVMAKILAHGGRRRLGAYTGKKGRAVLHYHRSPVFWIRAMDFEPHFQSPTKTKSTDHLKDIFFPDKQLVKRAGAVLSSTFFYFWFIAQGNCRNVAGPDIESYPMGEIHSAELAELEHLFPQLMSDLQSNSQRRVYNYKSGRVEYDEFYPHLSKPIIDKIDTVLARYYGLSAEETEFILNYDNKYRMRREGLEDETDED